MDNPGGDPTKRPQKTLAERRKAAKIAERITRQRMEDEELARAEEEQRIKQAEKVHEEEEYEFVRKEAQEQLDYEMAVKMSDIPTENPLLMPRVQVEETPTENPLLLPNVQHESQIQDQSLVSTGQGGCDEDHGCSHEQISHILNCEGCGGNFKGTKILKLHVKKNPDC